MVVKWPGVRRGRTLWLWPCVFLALAMAGCGSSAAYHGGSSWSFSLPSGWYRVNFSDSAGKVVSAGVQISNVPLQRPALMPGFPIQANDNALPSGGVALIVATDMDPPSWSLWSRYDAAAALTERVWGVRLELCQRPWR